MAYFQDAFGGFDPQVDVDAALKLALDAIVTDQRLSELTRLVEINDAIGGMGGDPGWLIERRHGAEVMDREWPNPARYRAFVEPAVYSLRHPEFFCDGRTFCRYVQSIANVYAQRHPQKDRDIQQLNAAIANAWRHWPAQQVTS